MQADHTGRGRDPNSVGAFGAAFVGICVAVVLGAVAICGGVDRHSLWPHGGAIYNDPSHKTETVIFAGLASTAALAGATRAMNRPVGKQIRGFQSRVCSADVARRIPSTFAVGMECDSLDAAGNWWRIKLESKNANGSFKANVCEDNCGTVWDEVWPKNCRPAG